MRWLVVSHVRQITPRSAPLHPPNFQARAWVPRPLARIPVAIHSEANLQQASRHAAYTWSTNSDEALSGLGNVVARVHVAKRKACWPPFFSAETSDQCRIRYAACGVLSNAMYILSNNVCSSVFALAACGSCGQWLFWCWRPCAVPPPCFPGLCGTDRSLPLESVLTCNHYAI